MIHALVLMAATMVAAAVVSILALTSLGYDARSRGMPSVRYAALMLSMNNMGIPAYLRSRGSHPIDVTRTVDITRARTYRALAVAVLLVYAMLITVLLVGQYF